MNIPQNTFHNDNFNMDYMKKIVRPESTNRIHCHPYHELLIAETGCIRYTVNNKIIEVKAPFVTFMPSYTIHNPFVQQSQIYERYKIEFDCNFFENFIKDVGLLNYLTDELYIKTLTRYDFDEIDVLVKSLYNLKNKNTFTETDSLYESMYLILILQKCNCAVSVESETDENYISKVTELIRDNYNKRITIDSIANSFYVSKSKLIYDFKNYCNMNILEYITMTKINFAKEHLKRGCSVATTSEKCGFSSPSYFIKVFTRLTGMTPLKFRLKYYKEL